MQFRKALAATKQSLPIENSNASTTPPQGNLRPLRYARNPFNHLMLLADSYRQYSSKLRLTGLGINRQQTMMAIGNNIM